MVHFYAMAESERPHAPGYTQHKDALLKRLARIEGQARGIARMVDEDRYCIDVLTQISAVQKAFDAVALELLNDHVRHCVIGSSGETQEERTDELMAAVGRLVKA
jgi:CsoR family transcriptional regulator, copper-sensing transcriptional repressor